MASYSSICKKIRREFLSRKLIELSPDINDVLITALIINITEPHMFMDKNNTQYKGVITFTIRDSMKHIVNCKFWGSWKKTEEYYNKYHLGDVVDIICPKIMLKRKTTPQQFKGKGDIEQPSYQPTTTLPVILILNEGYGSIEKHDFHDVYTYEELNQLWRTSHKRLNNVLYLKDINISVGSSNSGHYFSDFLVAVGLIKVPREFKLPLENKTKQCMELVVFDESLPDGMILTIWNKGWIKRANEFWKSMQTILHLIDVQISYSNFYKRSVLSLTTCGLIYENPYGEEAQTLRVFAGTVSPNRFGSLIQTNIFSNMPKPDEVVTIMTVQQIYAFHEDVDQFTAVLYAMITQFDLDGLCPILRKKCKACQRIIGKSKNVCDSEKCELFFAHKNVEDRFENFFEIQIHLSDHTGTLLEGRLSDSTAERVLGLNCLEFQKLNDNQLEELKWRFLMEYYRVKLVIKRTKNFHTNLIIGVVDMNSVDLDELSKNISIF